MTHSKRLSSLALAPLLAASIAVPAAVAMPIAQQDMHASTVHKPANVQQDLRSEAAKDPSRPAESPTGLPTWPVDPQPLTPPAAPQPASGDGGGVDVDWPVAVLAMAGTLLLGGGMGVAATRRRIGHTQAAG